MLPLTIVFRGRPTPDHLRRDDQIYATAFPYFGRQWLIDPRNSPTLMPARAFIGSMLLSVKPV